MHITKQLILGAAQLLFLSSLITISLLASCSDDEFDTLPPTIHFASDGVFEMAPQDTLVLEPKIVYGSKGSYLWTDEQGNVLSNELNYTFIPTVMKDYVFKFSVVTDKGTDSCFVFVNVLKHADFSEFQNFSIPKQQKLVLTPDTLPGAFRTMDLTFNNIINADTTGWAGFAFSNRITTSQTISSSAIGTAYLTSASKSNSYLVAAASADAAVVSFDRAYTPKSIDITNDNFVYLASKFGYMTTDSVIVSPAAQNDYYRVLFQGLDAIGMPTGTSVSFDLIECSYDNPAKFFRCAAWTTVPLTDLGSVSGIKMSVVTSLSQFPELFCIDNLKLQD